MTKGRRGEGEGNLKSVSIIKGDTKNQDKVGWFAREVQGSRWCVCQNRLEEYDDLVQYYSTLHTK